MGLSPFRPGGRSSSLLSGSGGIRSPTTNLAEIGARYLLTPQTVLSGSVGVGFGGDRSQDFRAVIGFQHTLSYPYSFDPPR